MEVTNKDIFSSVKVEEGERFDASDIFARDITDNYFANCGGVEREHEQFEKELK